jgi:hypothetical protein
MSLIVSCAFATDVRYWLMKARSEWSSIVKECILENTAEIRRNFIVTAVTDVAQLIIMLIGLLRSRREKRGFLRYLYVQVGVVFRVCSRQ